MPGMVNIANYLYRHEAELAKSLLDAMEIESWIFADDAGGMQPQLNFAMQGVRLLVPDFLAEEAKALLNSYVDSEDPEGSESAS